MSEASTGPEAHAVEIAARRLRGQVVAAPLVAAGAGLFGPQPERDLRLKLDMLQPAGTTLYRAALHYLLRQLGACKGIAVAAPPRETHAVVLAARPLRLPVHVVHRAGGDGDWPARWAALGCTVEAAAEPPAALQAFCRRDGYRPWPGLGDPDAAAGAATVGRELAAELPAHAGRVHVAAALADAVAAGLRAGGHAAAVVGVPPGPVPEGLGEALAREHRVLADAEGLSVLAAALRDPTEGTAAALLAC